MYDFGQEASYEGAVEGLTITRPIKLVGGAFPAASSTTAPAGVPHSAVPHAAAHFRNALGTMGTVGPEPDCEVFAFIICS